MVPLVEELSYMTPEHDGEQQHDQQVERVGAHSRIVALDGF